LKGILRIFIDFELIYSDTVADFPYFSSHSVSPLQTSIHQLSCLIQALVSSLSDSQ